MKSKKPCYFDILEPDFSTIPRVCCKVNRYIVDEDDIPCIKEQLMGEQIEADKDGAE